MMPLVCIKQPMKTDEHIECFRLGFRHAISAIRADTQLFTRNTFAIGQCRAIQLRSKQQQKPSKTTVKEHILFYSKNQIVQRFSRCTQVS